MEKSLGSPYNTKGDILDLTSSLPKQQTLVTLLPGKICWRPYLLQHDNAVVQHNIPLDIENLLKICYIRHNKTFLEDIMLQTIRGTKDILPDEMATHRYIVQKRLWKLQPLYNFREVQTPIFESTDVFKRTLGDESDVVSKKCTRSKIVEETPSPYVQKELPYYPRSYFQWSYPVTSFKIYLCWPHAFKIKGLKRKIKTIPSSWV